MLIQFLKKTELGARAESEGHGGVRGEGSDRMERAWMGEEAEAQAGLAGERTQRDCSTRQPVSQSCRPDPSLRRPQDPHVHSFHASPVVLGACPVPGCLTWGTASCSGFSGSHISVSSGFLPTFWKWKPSKGNACGQRECWEQPMVLTTSSCSALPLHFTCGWG